MGNQPLLTVIVPCYNMEKHVDKCISSIVGQTYTNLEILLIDDGSTDNTGNICDAWQEKDQRIRVIHKKNEGLSCTRKAGAENATTEYIAYVDADDWIDANMYTDMMSALLSTGSDIADCDFCCVYEDGRMKSRVDHHTGSIQVHGRTEGVLILLKDNGTYRTNFGTKVYKKSLFENLPFQKGSNHGEDYINHELFHRASQTVFIDRPYYFYFQRSGSVTKPKHANLQNDLKNARTLSEAIYDRYIFTERNPEYHSALPIVKYMAICSGIYLLRNIIANSKYFTNEYFHAFAKQVCSISILREYKLPRCINVEWHTLKISCNMYRILRLLYIKIIRVTNKLKITNWKTTMYTTSDIWFIWKREGWY